MRSISTIPCYRRTLDVRAHSWAVLMAQSCVSCRHSRSWVRVSLASHDGSGHCFDERYAANLGEFQVTHSGDFHHCSDRGTGLKEWPNVIHNAPRTMSHRYALLEGLPTTRKVIRFNGASGEIPGRSRSQVGKPKLFWVDRGLTGGPPGLSL